MKLLHKIIFKILGFLRHFKRTHKYPYKVKVEKTEGQINFTFHGHKPLKFDAATQVKPEDCITVRYEEAGLKKNENHNAYKFDAEDWEMR